MKEYAKIEVRISSSKPLITCVHCRCPDYRWYTEPEPAGPGKLEFDWCGGQRLCASYCVEDTYVVHYYLGYIVPPCPSCSFEASKTARTQEGYRNYR